MKDLQQHVQQIADIIEQGYTVTAEDVDNYDQEYQAGDILSGFDYIADAYDFRYLLDSNGNLIQAQICVAHGGPNIWVNIWHDGTGVVEGYWWGDRAKASITDDAMAIFEACEELYLTR